MEFYELRVKKTSRVVDKAISGPRYNFVLAAGRGIPVKEHGLPLSSATGLTIALLLPTTDNDREQFWPWIVDKAGLIWTTGRRSVIIWMGISTAIHVCCMDEAGIVIGDVVFIVLIWMCRERVCGQICRSIEFRIEPWDNCIPFGVRSGLERALASVEDVPSGGLGEALIVKGQLVTVAFAMHNTGSLGVDCHRC